MVPPHPRRLRDPTGNRTADRKRCAGEPGIHSRAVHRRRVRLGERL